MPSERTLLYAGTELTVEHVCARTHGPDWSAPYTIDSRRIVLPVGHTVLDLRSGDNTWLVDGLTAMHLNDAMVYQLRPSSTHATRHSMVVRGHRALWASEAPVFSLLSPASVYRVHAAQKRLRDGDAGPYVVASLLDEIGRSRQLMPLNGNGTVARAKKLLAETADREARLSIHAVADAVSRSPFHLARSFRQQTGLSLHQYRQHLRLAKALDRLAGGDRDLAGIAHDLGYCSQSHLGAVFRREVGVTLGEARRSLATARI